MRPQHIPPWRAVLTTQYSRDKRIKSQPWICQYICLRLRLPIESQSVVKAGGTGDEYVGSYRQMEMLAEQGNLEKQKMQE